MTFADIITKVPGIPASANDEFVITAEGTLPSADRKILRFLTKSEIPDLPPELYSSLRTLGELRELVEAQGRTSSSPALEFGSYMTNSVFMRPVMPQDHEQLYFASLEPTNSFRWRFRGQTVSFRDFSESLSAGTLCQFAFADIETSGLVAFCSAYNYDPVAHHCTFAVQRLDFDSKYDTSVIESVALFLNYLFETFNVRKVFADIPEYNFPNFGLVKDVFEMDGEKRDYYWHAGRYWSEMSISTSRDAWLLFASMFFLPRTSA